MSEPDRAAAAFQELYAGIARQIRRPASDAIRRLTLRRRRRRMRVAASCLAAVVAAAFALALSVRGAEPPITPVPSTTASPSASVTTAPTPSTSESAVPAGQASSEQCSNRGVVRPAGPVGTGFSSYKVRLINVVCPGVRVRVVWATYTVTDVQTPQEVQTLYRQGTVYLDRDNTTLTFPLSRPPGCWRGYVGYGDVSVPATINGSQPIFGTSNIGAMMLNCSTASPTP